MFEEVRKALQYVNENGESVSLLGLPLLDRETEKKLLREARENKDPAVRTEARTKLILHNLKLVYPYAYRNADIGTEFVDRFQTGIIGLYTAIEKFDPRKKIAFSTYASWWIRGTITRSLTNTSKVVRFPVDADTDLRRIRRIRRKVDEKKYKGMEFINEIAKCTELKPERVMDLLKAEYRYFHMRDLYQEVQMKGRRSPLLLIDIIPDRQSISPETILLVKQKLEWNCARISFLISEIRNLQKLESQERERAKYDYFLYYFGFDHPESSRCKAYGEVAEKFHISYNAARFALYNVWKILNVRDIAGDTRWLDDLLDETEFIAEFVSEGHYRNLVFADMPLQKKALYQEVKKSFRWKHRSLKPHAKCNVSPQKIKDQIQNAYGGLRWWEGEIRRRKWWRQEVLPSVEKKEAKSATIFLFRLDLGWTNTCIAQEFGISRESIGNDISFFEQRLLLDKELYKKVLRIRKCYCTCSD